MSHHQRFYSSDIELFQLHRYISLISKENLQPIISTVHTFDLWQTCVTIPQENNLLIARNTLIY